MDGRHLKSFPQDRRSRSLQEGGAEEFTDGLSLDQEAVVAVGGLDLVVG